jgi:hypothetical protein
MQGMPRINRRIGNGARMVCLLSGFSSVGKTNCPSDHHRPA